jgi:transcriptional regulator with XRE-family HTH domain
VGRPVSGNLARKTDTTDEALGAVITELRVKKGWGYEDVAHKVGCSPSYINGIEHGKQNPTLRVIQAIADVHGLKLSKLFALAERKYARGRR